MLVTCYTQGHSPTNDHVRRTIFDLNHTITFDLLIKQDLSEDNEARLRVPDSHDSKALQTYDVICSVILNRYHRYDEYLLVFKI